MTIQEAYNKGLDDAENVVIDKLTQMILGNIPEEFPNPKLQALMSILTERSEYYRKNADRRNNLGKHFKRKVAEHVQTLTNAQLIVN
jgi:hypothetical protein